MFRDCVFWIGAVENNEDPEKRGRVQVRIFGAHDIYNQHMTDYAGRTQWAARYKNVGGSSSSSSSSSSSGSGLSSGKNTGSAQKSSGSGQSGGTGNKAYLVNNSYMQRSQRNNNPLNMYGGSWRYNDISEGAADGLRQLQRYQSSWKKSSTGYGLVKGTDGTTGSASLADIWRTIAPSSDNNNYTEKNIKKLANKMGIDPNAPLDLSDDNTLFDVFCGITATESSIRLTREDCAAALAGQYTQNMTSQSTYLAPDGTLVVGASNATIEGADKSKTGRAYAPSSSTKWRDATEEEQAASQAGIKNNTFTPGSTPKASTPSSDSSGNASGGATTPAGSAGAQAQQASVIGDGASPTKDVSTAGSPDSTCHTLPTGDLPWAFCLYPCSEYGGTSYGTLPAPQVQNGAWVVGMSLDGAFMNQLVILGIMPSAINIDVLSTNPNQSSTNPLTNITLPNSTPSSSNNSTKVKNMTLAELQDGIWNAESSRSANKKRSSAYCYGAMQLAPALAAEYILRGAASNELAAAGLTLSDDMKASLQSITNSYGKKIIPFLESDSNIAKFCDVLTENDTLNKAIGAAYLEDCATAAGGDPVITALYYMQGDGNAKKILSTYGYTNGLPDTVSYATFAEQATEWMRNHKQSNDFTIYLNNITKDYGGLSALEAARTSAS